MSDRPNVFADRENRLCVYAPRATADQGGDATPYVLGEFNSQGDFITHQRVGEVPDGYYWAGDGARQLANERSRRIKRRDRRVVPDNDQSFDDLLAGIRTLAAVIATLSARHTEVCEERDQQRIRAEAAEYDLAELRRATRT
ncbi:hypothetical protein KNV22_gp69 [Gordonia phage Love]|uniref:Uncharacterized protein n=2 Tax=Vividuovirus TaxID=2560251 RepID=A0A385DVG9_9CAUD|nr:hypothetical protein KNU06_gp64 [Gordonia phage Angelicage]YP_010109904.1 hypothetical protein KNV22_gp69 [Gordonia phage Love]AYR02448.1 hypothetical protein SEA_AFFECA_65 [Gordonia phage Affeca]UYL87739.1 hypothetical protein SEA_SHIVANISHOLA_64 [Gordonia phage Shivanishola]AXQ62768.1 hypothetical protein SEA_ANGELICAGE_64 [Gordonia phage Angelicage]QNJ57789.1 hypothetical protein SEA_LOVE_69 [Gordonia phage Love]